MIKGSVEVSRVPKLPQDPFQQTELSSAVKLHKSQLQVLGKKPEKLQSPLSFSSRLMGAAWSLSCLFSRKN